MRKLIAERMREIAEGDFAECCEQPPVKTNGCCSCTARCWDSPAGLVHLAIFG